MLFYQVCADIVEAKQSTAEYGHKLCLFLPSNKFTFDKFLTVNVVSESHVTWATSVPILVFPSLSVIELGPMYATDVRRASSLNAPTLGAGHNKIFNAKTTSIVR